TSLLNAALPDLLGRLAVRAGARDLRYQDLSFCCITRRSAINNDSVAKLQREARYAAFRQLRRAGPLATPTGYLSVFADNFDADERMRITNIEFRNLADDRDGLILNVRSREGMVGICGYAECQHHNNGQREES